MQYRARVRLARACVPVYDLERVQILKRHRDLCGIESRVVVRKSVFPAQVREKLAAGDVFKQHVQSPVVLHVPKTARV